MLELRLHNQCILKDDEGRKIDVTVVNGMPDDHSS